MNARRTRNLLNVSSKLFWLTLGSLAFAVVLFAIDYFGFGNKRLMLSWLSFVCGIVGGFVSIQQRLQKISDDELSLLQQSWLMVLVIPIFGGVFALVLYVLFLSGLINSKIFPAFYIPQFDDPPTADNIQAFLTLTNPKSGEDLAKLIFWTFCAGFSERLVPQIIRKVSSDPEGASSSAPSDKDNAHGGDGS
jgi:hypothetical protein